MTTAAEPIGLIAGWGRLPILFAEKAKSLGIPVVCRHSRHGGPCCAWNRIAIASVGCVLQR